MAAKAPTPPAQRPPTANAGRYLVYGFAASILLHLIFGPFLGQFKTAKDEGEKVEQVSVTKKITKIQTPKPTPTPAPTPTPPPEKTPPPVKTTPQPEVKRLKVDVPKTTSQSNSGPSEAQYNVKSGSEEGAPQGNSDKGNTAAPATAPPAATPVPTPTPTPRPQCANPNVDAVATNKITPDMPEIARQMGASGTASVRVALSETGAVQSVDIYKSTGNKSLDQAAVQAAKQSSYQPEIRNCVKTAGEYLYTVTFENQ
jgi:protein TonB